MSIRTRKRRKEAQVWFFDFMIGVLIFSSAIIIYFNTREDFSDAREIFLEDLVTRSKIATEDLMSIGYPENWNATNLTRIGLIGDDKKIDVSKITQFYNLTPSMARNYLGLEGARYFVFIEYLNDSVISFNGYNHSGESPEEDSIVVQTTRLSVYNSSIVRLRFLVWRKP
jgi:hypothetical protein